MIFAFVLQRSGNETTRIKKTFDQEDKALVSF
jgi:hypothetical protein